MRPWRMRRCAKSKGIRQKSKVKNKRVHTTTRERVSGLLVVRSPIFLILPFDFTFRGAAINTGTE
jgi:hypothetical protein